MTGCVCTNRLPSPDPISTTEAILSAEVVCTGAMRWGRTQTGTANWTAVKMTSVTAMAGTVRRMSTPAVNPRAKANAAYPTGTMPSEWKLAGLSRSMVAVSIGLDHQVTMRLSSPATAMLNTPTRPSLTASQRVRVMP